MFSIKKMEPTTGLEPVNLFLTKEVLYLLSYVGFRPFNLFFLPVCPCSPRQWLVTRLPLSPTCMLLFPGGEGRIRTSEGLRRQIYSLLPLATREPLHTPRILLLASLKRQFKLFLSWSWRWDSNPQPADYKSAALPIELRQLPHISSIHIISTHRNFKS